MEHKDKIRAVSNPHQYEGAFSATHWNTFVYKHELAQFPVRFLAAKCSSSIKFSSKYLY